MYHKVPQPHCLPSSGPLSFPPLEKGGHTCVQNRSCSVTRTDPMSERPTDFRRLQDAAHAHAQARRPPCLLGARDQHGDREVTQRKAALPREACKLSLTYRLFDAEQLALGPGECPPVLHLLDFQNTVPDVAWALATRPAESPVLSPGGGGRGVGLSHSSSSSPHPRILAVLFIPKVSGGWAPGGASAGVRKDHLPLPLSGERCGNCPQLL